MADEIKPTITPSETKTEMPPRQNFGSGANATFNTVRNDAGSANSGAENSIGAKAQASFKGQKQGGSNIDLVMSIPVEVQIVLGSTTMPVATLMNLGRGAVITLDKQIGDPVDIVVNGRVIARGEVIVLDDDSSRFGVSLIEVLGKY